MKVEVVVLGSPSSYSPYDPCGRKATLNLNLLDETGFEKFSSFNETFT